MLKPLRIGMNMWRNSDDKLVPGDIVWLDKPNDGGAGHVTIVHKILIDSNGNRTIYVIEATTRGRDYVHYDYTIDNFNSELSHYGRLKIAE